MKKILFISKDNLTTNPRLLKELKFAVKLGYNVDFIGFNSGNWSDKIDAELVKNINANFHYIPITRKPFFKWFLNSIIEKVAQKLYPIFKHNLKINSFAHSKRSVLLNKYLQKSNNKYDLIIAHTLPTLYPAYNFAKKTNTKYTFDIEDFHPGEVISANEKNETARRIFLMKTILPKAIFITYASPLIGEHSLKLLSNYPEKQHKLINNCFSETEFQYVDNKSDKIKFVWFSQNISQNRGLELIVPVLAKFKHKVELYLIGNLYQNFYTDFLEKYKDFITINKPLPQKELNLSLAKFDVGLAVEPEKDFNNKIALSNKIFAYTQAGLFVFATDTPAQSKLLEEHKNIGITSKQDVENLLVAIQKIINNIEEIRKQKQVRFNYAQKLSWENESNKLIETWQNLIK